jgi:hypothetical protein
MGVAGTPWCTRKEPLSGWVLHHLAEYDAPLRADLIAVYALDRGPGIVAIAPGSPAERTGLLPGDTILSVNGLALASLVPVPGKLGGASRKPGTKVEDAIEQQLARPDAKLRVLRDGATLDVSLTAPMGCPARIRVATGHSESAFADGTYAIFSTKALKAARNDDELAALVGHELAHNFLRHKDRRASGDDKRPKREQEAEADAFSLRLGAAAGYDLDAALPFWKRLLDPNILDKLGISDHYPKGERLAAFTSELKTVQASPGSVTWNGVTLPRPKPR